MTDTISAADTFTATSTPTADILTTTDRKEQRPLVLPEVVTKGWHADPMAIHKMRWHNGAEWTEHVTHFGPVPCQHCGL